MFGRERERARERKERAGESEREQGGSGRAAGVVHAARRSSASRRWPGTHARTPRFPSAYWQEEEDRRRWAGSRWADPVGHQVSGWRNWAR